MISAEMLFCFHISSPNRIFKPKRKNTLKTIKDEISRRKGNRASKLPRLCASVSEIPDDLKAPTRDLVAEIWDKWPGDESVEEILEALRSGKDIERNMATDLRFPGPIFEHGHFRPQFRFLVKPATGCISQRRGKDALPPRFDRINLLYGIGLGWKSDSPRLALNWENIVYDGQPSGYVALELLDAWDIVDTSAVTQPTDRVAAMKVDLMAGLWHVRKQEISALGTWLHRAFHWNPARLHHDVEDGEYTTSIEFVPGTTDSQARLTAYLGTLDDKSTVGYIGVSVEKECTLPASVLDGRYGDDQFLKFTALDDILAVFSPVLSALVEWESFMDSVQER